MKKIVFWLTVISVVGCHNDEPIDPVETVNKVDDIIGTYQAIRIFECTPTPNYYDCESSIQDAVLVLEKISESSFRVLGFEAQVDKDGKISCCADLGYQVDVKIDVTIRNDTLWTRRLVRRAHGILDEERYIGVKGAKSPLKAGTVGFRSAAYEQSEYDSPALIYLDLEGAIFGAEIIIDILNTSTATYFGVHGGDAKLLSDNKLGVTVMPNTTSATIGLMLGNDHVLNSLRKIQFRISDASVGITPSENRNHTFTILDDDEPSINKIIFSQNNSVYDINSDGSGLRRRWEWFIGSHSPSFSPDGNRVVFVMAEDFEEGEVCSMTYLGDDFTPLTKNDRIESSPSYSPAGDKILFIAVVQDSPMNSQIFTMNPDGTGETQISHIDNGTEPLEIKSTSWSPDGTQIVFTSNLGNEGVGFRNYIMNADGSNVRRLANEFRSEGHPRFSPDGQKIIFNVGAENEESLYLMNADGTGEEKLFSGIAGLTARDAEWSPDGQTIIFQGRIDSPDFSTFTSRIDGSNFGMMTNQGMDHASWSPAK